MHTCCVMCRTRDECVRWTFLSFLASVMVVNDELLQRLTNGKAGPSRTMVIPRTSDTSAPLNYHSPPGEVTEWLTGKGFGKP